MFYLILIRFCNKIPRKTLYVKLLLFKKQLQISSDCRKFRHSRILPALDFLKLLAKCHVTIKKVQVYSTKSNAKCLLFLMHDKVLIVLRFPRSVLVSFPNNIQRIFFPYDEFRLYLTGELTLWWLWKRDNFFTAKLTRDFDILQSNCLMDWFLVIPFPDTIKLKMTSKSSIRFCHFDFWYFQSSNPCWKV